MEDSAGVAAVELASSPVFAALLIMSMAEDDCSFMLPVEAASLVELPASMLAELLSSAALLIAAAAEDCSLFAVEDASAAVDCATAVLTSMAEDESAMTAAVDDAASAVLASVAAVELASAALLANPAAVLASTADDESATTAAAVDESKTRSPVDEESASTASNIHHTRKKAVSLRSVWTQRRGPMAQWCSRRVPPWSLSSAVSLSLPLRCCLLRCWSLSPNVVVRSRDASPGCAGGAAQWREQWGSALTWSGAREQQRERAEAQKDPAKRREHAGRRGEGQGRGECQKPRKARVRD